MIMLSFVLFAALIVAWLAAPDRETRADREPVQEIAPVEGTRSRPAELGFQG